MCLLDEGADHLRFLFQYMLDNKLEDAKGISADQIFRTELFGDEK